MARKEVCLVLYWGGKMINDSDGWTYDRPHRAIFNFIEGTNHEQLLLKLYNIMGINGSNAKLKLTCKCIRVEGLHKFSYMVADIVDENSLRFAMNSSFNNPFFNMLDLYIEILDTATTSYINVVDVPVFSPSRSPQLTQLTPNPIHPLSQGRIVSPREVSVSPSQFHHNEGCPVRTVRNLFPSSNMPVVVIPPLRVSDVDSRSRNENAINNDSLNDDVDSDDDVDYSTNDNCSSDEGNESNESGRETESVPKFCNQLIVVGNQVGLENGRVSTVEQLRLGMMFRSKKELQSALNKYSIGGAFEYVVKESTTKVWAVKCVQYRVTCKWRMRAIVRKKYEGLFEITKFVEPHTCVFPEYRPDAKHLDDNMISTRLVHVVEANPSIKNAAIKAVIYEWYGYKISYWKAYHAKKKAIARVFCEWKGSYNKLESYMGGIIQTNLGTVHELITKVGEGNCRVFDKNFFSFGASIEGFVHCRPIISIDATHLRGKYMGKMFTAMSFDANGQIFSLAFGFAEEESFETWGFFLKHLYNNVVRDREGICLLSDRHSGILAVIRNGDPNYIPPKTYHRFCIRHVRCNFCTKFKASKRLKDLFWLAATSNQERKFNHYMTEIKKYDDQTENEEKKPWRWLFNTPLEKWTLLYDGGHRYGVTSTNISEVFNSILLGTRNLPITASVRLIFYRIVAYFCNRRESGLKRVADPETIHVPDVAARLERLKIKARTHSLCMYRTFPAIVGVETSKRKKHEVNVEQKTCTCNKWLINKFPCSHVVAVYGELRIELIAMLDKLYSLESYVATWTPQLYPVLNEDDWLKVTSPELFPDYRLLRKKGRPKARIHNEMDISDRTRILHCGLCGVEGHTQRKCPTATL